MNFGRNYEGARDDFVYIYSPDTATTYEASDGFVLGRVPKGHLANRDAYEFFMGVSGEGQPLWTMDIQKRGPVFLNPGQCYRSNVSYDAGLKRYLWCQTLPGGDPRFEGGFAIYDAPEPWGPWTETFSTSRWDIGPGESSSFPTKWTSPDGKKLWLVFSGDDSFSVRAATIDW